MRTTFKLRNPDEMEATISITMTMKHWRELRDQMGESWPAWDIKCQITDVIRQAEGVFYAKPEEQEVE